MPRWQKLWCLLVTARCLQQLQEAPWSEDALSSTRERIELRLHSGFCQKVSDMTTKIIFTCTYTNFFLYFILISNDIDTIQMSNLQNLMMEIQENRINNENNQNNGNAALRYCLLGDGIFRHLAHDNVVLKSYHVAPHWVELQEWQLNENKLHFFFPDFIVC